MPKIDQWLEELGLGRYAAVFADNDIDFDVLPDLNDKDLAALGVSLGHRKKLLRAIAALGEATVETAAPPAPPVRAIALPERRHLTVMFCDLVGSTELSTRLDPEDLRDVMQRFQEACVEVICRYGGHIGNYIGDGILAYFGYPRAHEDDAQRAVRAGLGMVEAIAALNDAVPQPGIQLAIRIGINTGLVVVGDIGTGESRDEMAVVGETPNVAARLQDLAEPGSVVVGASTYRLIEGLFVCDDLGPLAVRGVSAPVAVYRVREPTGASRFEATATRGLTPLVGREDEVRVLLSRWRQAKDGEGQVVLLSGEPGIGKSRLIQSLREQLQEEPRVNLHYFCSPFYSSSALYPVLDQLERAADFRRHDPPTVKLEKLEALLGQASASPGQAAALLAPLLAIPTEGRYPPLDLTPQQHRAKVFATLLDQLTGLASRDPVLMIFEDAHWIDPTSIELFQQVVDRVQRLPILLVLVFRPDFAPPWSGYPHISSLSLGRLGHRQAAAMVERVTGGKPLPFEVVEQIVAQDRRRAAVRRGADQDDPGGGPAGRCGRPLRADRPAAGAGDPDHAARFADGAPRQARAGQGGRPAGRDARARVQPRAAGGPLAPRPGGARAGADRAGRGGASVPPRLDARGHLRVQARAAPGCRLWQPAARQAPAAARPHRPGARGALSAYGRSPARAAGTPFPRGGPARARDPLRAPGRRCGGRALRLGRGARPLWRGARDGPLAAARRGGLARAGSRRCSGSPALPATAIISSAT